MAKNEGQRNPEKHQTKNISHRQINCVLLCLVGLLLRLSDHISLRLSASQALRASAGCAKRKQFPLEPTERPLNSTKTTTRSN